MKKIINSIGLMPITLTPILATTACGVSSGTSYFYDLSVTAVEQELIVVIRHLPTENNLNDDYLEEYRRIIYNDMGNQIINIIEESDIDSFTITFLSADYDGDEETYSLDFANSNEPLRLLFEVPEHTDDAGNVVQERMFRIHSFAEFFRADILDHVKKDSLLNTSPTSGDVISGRYTEEGYIIRRLIYDFLRD